MYPLRVAAEKEGMSVGEQGKKWLQLWTNVCKKVKATCGTCFVMARGSGPGDCTLEGNAQQGEVNVLLKLGHGNGTTWSQPSPGLIHDQPCWH